MKVELTKNGYLKITAETVVEAFALNGIFPVGAEVCKECNSIPHNLIVDCSILSDDTTSKYTDTMG